MRISVSLMLSLVLAATAVVFVSTGQLDGLQRLVERAGDRDRASEAAVYTRDGQPLAMTASLPARFQTLPDVGREATARGDQRRGVFLVDGELWRQNFMRLLVYVLLISLTTLLIVRWSLVRPLSKTIEWIRRLRTGEPAEPAALPKSPLFAPLARELTQMAQSLLAAQAAAEEEARLRNAGESRWTPERLRVHVQAALQGRPLLVVSNREPYMHVRQGRQMQCVVPPGGLVTAMEPILRACPGTWLAHGAGAADRETADAHGRLRVPPETPLYTLRRVWLEKEEEAGYYYGFANEGLWPLCHIAHTRPIFRTNDWACYSRVNAKFADAVFEEAGQTPNPFLLIQDYHFALLPRLVKAQRPDAQIALFWHIPWPNPEAFAICPWARELLHGMLGADLIGFQTQFHCNNFLATVDRMLESRIDWEQFTVNRAEHTTRVKPFPISVAWSQVSELPGEAEPTGSSASALKERVLKRLGLRVRWLGVGVDRLDYTKGILERFQAIERFLEKYPAFREQVTVIELGAPSRTLITRYHTLELELDAEVERINARFQTRSWKPLVFLKKHHSHEEIAPFYRAADLCLVTSLHDGMNLVSKEFVAAREDLRGALILSQFAGAAQELRGALIINPYDFDQMADAIHDALTMDPEEQKARMIRMREILQAHNVHRWAANLVTELARIHPAREAKSR